MADRLTFFLNKYEIAPHTQFSARKGSSTKDAALTLTHDIQNACNKGLITTALTLDIKEYFDFINHKNLLSKMRNARLPLPMVKWMHTFLSECKAAIHLDGQCMAIKQVLNSSPISVPALSLYTAELLQLMHKIAKES
jgi:hypothetical protein